MPRLLQLLLLALIAPCVLFASARVVDAQLPSENAALQYWRAFAQMPKLSGKDLSQLNNATTDHPTEGFAVPVGPDLERLFRGSGEAALSRLRLASGLPYCTWGTDLRRDGPDAVPYAEQAHQLARMSLLRARWRFEHGQWDDGIDDVIDTMVMARNIGRDKMLITIHFGVMIETMSVVTVAVYAPRFPPEPRAKLAEALARLPAFTSMSDVFRHSEGLVDWFISYVQQAEKDGCLRERIEVISSPELAASVIEGAPDAATLAARAESLRGLLREGADLLARPVEEFRQEYTKRNISQRLIDNPVGLILTVSFDGECNEQAVGRVRLALLRAGIEVLKRGPTVLNDDSVSGEFGPFQYSTFDGGVDLRSNLSIPEGSPNCQSLDFGLRQGGPLLTRPFP